MIRVLLCDDQEVVLEGLRTILKASPGVEVVGLAHNGAEALEMAGQLKPDVVLMDLKMPVMNGIQATQRIRAQHPQVRVLVLTTYDDDEWLFDAVRSGAAGYLLKDTPREKLVAALEGTAAGQTYVDPNVAGKLFSQVAQSAPPAPDRALLQALSERELEVLRWLARGLNNVDIAQRLYLSEGTVKNHVSAIFTKLGVADRMQAALLALRAGLVDLSER